MTATTQTQSRHRKALDFTTAALGVLLIVLGAASYCNLVNEQISVVVSLALIGLSIAAFWNWARNYKADSPNI